MLCSFFTAQKTCSFPCTSKNTKQKVTSPENWRYLVISLKIKRLRGPGYAAAGSLLKSSGRKGRNRHRKNCSKVSSGGAEHGGRHGGRGPAEHTSREGIFWGGRVRGTESCRWGQAGVPGQKVRHGHLSLHSADFIRTERCSPTNQQICTLASCIKLLFSPWPCQLSLCLRT